jgi:tetratricopeptide (TPR) repeat protein
MGSIVSLPNNEEHVDTNDYENEESTMLIWFDPNIKTLNNIGLILENQENYDEALEYSEQAREVLSI